MPAGIGGPPEGGQVPRTIFEDPPEDDDIFVTKHLLGSQSPAQETTAFFPGLRLREFASTGPKPTPGRVQLSPNQKKEFAKTANTIGKVHYNLCRASDWPSVTLVGTRRLMDCL